MHWRQNRIPQLHTRKFNFHIPYLVGLYTLKFVCLSAKCGANTIKKRLCIVDTSRGRNSNRYLNQKIKL